MRRTRRSDVVEEKKLTTVAASIAGSLSLMTARQRVALGALGALRIASNLLDLGGIVLVASAAGIATGNETALRLPGFKNLDVNGQVLFVLVLAAIVFTTKTVAGVQIARGTFNYLSRIEVFYSNRVARELLGGRLKDLRSLSQAELEWAVLRSTSVAFPRLLGQVITLVAELSLAAMILTFLFFQDWISALLLVGYFSAVVACLQFFSRKVLARAGKEFASNSVGVSQAIANIVATYREIYVASKLSYFLEVLGLARSKVSTSAATLAYINVFPRLILELALVFGALFFAAWFFAAENQVFDAAVFATFLLGGLRTVSALLPLQRSSMAIISDAALALSAQEILAEHPSLGVDAARADIDVQVVPKTAALVANDRGIKIDVDDVSLIYGSAERGGLNAVSLEVASGASVAIVGPSGAGKSTLLDLILGLTPAQSGVVKLDGHSPETLRARYPGALGYVPQKPGVVRGSISENIALGVPQDEVDDGLMAYAITFSKLDGFVESRDMGLKEQLGTHSDSLSGGELQRLGLARAIYRRPRLLVLDEATSALDAETENKIVSNLSSLRGETTVVTVAHRLSTIRACDKIYLIEAGRNVAHGSFDELMKQNSLFQRYVKFLDLSGAGRDHLSD